MPSRIGVVCIQGDFEKHLDALARIECVEPREVRTSEDLKGVSGIIIPGGESTTVGKLMQRYGLGEAIREYYRSGMGIWGTCMGMILLANRIEDHEQYSLNLLDVSIRRNAFGAQVHSFEDVVQFADFESPLTAVFIRAPIVTALGEGVEVLARYQNDVVAVRQDRILGTSFHPELTNDLRVHEYFLSMCV